MQTFINGLVGLDLVQSMLVGAGKSGVMFAGPLYVEIHNIGCTVCCDGMLVAGWLLVSLHFTSLHLSHSLFDRWGTKEDRATTVLHSSLFSAFRRASPYFNPVHSVMLSSHLFFCLPLLLPPCTVPCRIIFASPVDLVLCPYRLSFRFFTVVRGSS